MDGWMAAADPATSFLRPPFLWKKINQPPIIILIIFIMSYNRRRLFLRLRLRGGDGPVPGHRALGGGAGALRDAAMRGACVNCMGCWVSIPPSIHADTEYFAWCVL